MQRSYPKSAHNPGSEPAGGSSPRAPLQPFYTTASGRLYLGDAFSVLQCLIREGVRAKLVVTSPPFPLVTKKSYGNVDQEQ